MHTAGSILRRRAARAVWVLPCVLALACGAVGVRGPGDTAEHEAAPPGEETPLAAVNVTDTDQVGPPASLAKSQKKPRSARLRFLEASRLPGLPGPLAPSVHAALTEMLIESRLQTLAAAEAPLDARGGALLGAVPSYLPADGYVSSSFGPRRSPFTGRLRHHNGIDIGVPHGAPVHATADGLVAYAGWRKFLGKTVVIDHGFGIVTKYAHNSALSVRTGDAVRRGDVIAKAGSTGSSTGTHLHYEVWVNGRPVDPMRFMFDVPARPAESVEAHLAMLRDRPSVASDKESDEPLPMGGEVLWSDAPEIGAASPFALLAPDPREQLGVNVAIVSVFLLLSAIVVLCARPREPLS